MRLAKIKYIIFISVFAPLSAFAECKYIKEGLERKMKEYQEFRQRNEETLKALLSTESTCHSKGAEISGRIAEMAEGLSCQAELDASNVDIKMAEIGEQCEAVFKRIKEFQTKAHIAFEQLRIDVDDGLAYMKDSRPLQEHCRREIEETQQMAKEFLALELSIVAVERRSLDGMVSYGKFKETARSLHALTKARNSGCGELVSKLNGVLKPLSGGPAQRASLARGKSRNSESSITGVPESLRAKAEGEAILNRQQPGRSELGVRQLGPSLVSARDSAGAAVEVVAGGTLVPKAGDSRAIVLERAPAQLSSIGSALWVDSGAAERKIAAKTAPQPIAQSILPGNGGSVASPVAVASFAPEVSIHARPVVTSNAQAGPVLLNSPGVVALGELRLDEPGRQVEAAKPFAEERDIFTRVSRAYHATELFRSAGRRQVARGTR